MKFNKPEFTHSKIISVSTLSSDIFKTGVSGLRMGPGGGGSEGV